MSEICFGTLDFRITEFGKFCRELRIGKGVILYDQAVAFGISSSAVSRREVGRVTPDEEYYCMVSEYFNLGSFTQRYLRGLKTSNKKGRW